MSYYVDTDKTIDTTNTVLWEMHYKDTTQTQNIIDYFNKLIK